MNEIGREEELLKKRFYLERFYIRSHGVLGKLFPLLFTIIFLIVGFFAGIFEPQIDIMAKISFIFWILFIPLTVYLMAWLDKSIKKTIRKTNQLIRYEHEVQRNLLNSLYGAPGIVISLIIAIPFIIYDITGFGFGPIIGQGWLYDITQLDDTWYPGISAGSTVNLGSLLWIVVWVIPWFFMGALIWMSIAFLLYMRAKLKETKWKDDIRIVIKEKQHKSILTASIMTFIPLSPYIAIKFIYQVFFQPWWSDTISMYMLFIIFIIGTIIAPTIIAGDIDKEKKEALIGLNRIKDAKFFETAKNLLDGKDLSTDIMLRAVLIHLYTEEMNVELKKKTLDRHLVNKMIVAALVPIITYAMRIILGPILGF